MLERTRCGKRTEITSVLTADPPAGEVSRSWNSAISPCSRRRRKKA